MNKNFRITTLFAALFMTISSAGAQNSVETIASEYGIETLSPEIATQIAHLMTYGDRYGNLIQQILLEAAKPDWSWND